MYALERLFATSGERGTDLTNFNAVTGVTIKTLQQYQYAAQQVGISNQEVESSFKNIQKAMTDTLLGKGGAKWVDYVSNLTKEMGAFDITKYQQNPELLIQRLQLYAQREKNKGLMRDVLGSFSITEGMQAGLAKNAFRPEVLAKAPIYSDREAEKLTKMQADIANLETKIQMAIGHFAAVHGDQLIKDVSGIADQVLRLTGALVLLAEKLHAFEGLEKVLEGLRFFAEGQVTKSMNEAINEVGGKDKGFLGKTKIVLDALIGNSPGSNEPLKVKSPGILQGQLPTPQDIIPGAPVSSPSGAVTNNYNVNQSVEFKDSENNAANVGRSFKKSVLDAAQNLSSRSKSN